MAHPDREQHSRRNSSTWPFLSGPSINSNRLTPPLKVIEAASASNLPSVYVTPIRYSYGLHGVTCHTEVLGKKITLRQFKSLLIMKGNFRYFFKKASAFGTGVVFEEVTEDSKVLPLWEGQAVCVVEPVHP